MEFFLIYLYATALNLREIISHTWGLIFLVGLAYVVISGIHLFHRMYSKSKITKTEGLFVQWLKDKHGKICTQNRIVGDIPEKD